MNACFSFSGMDLNHSIALLVLFHSFHFGCLEDFSVNAVKDVFADNANDLLGLISLQVGLFKKSGLWSFIAMKESLHADVAIWSSLNGSS